MNHSLIKCSSVLVKCSFETTKATREWRTPKELHKKVLVSVRQNIKKSKNNHHMRVKDAEGSAKCARSAHFALPEASFRSLLRRFATSVLRNCFTVMSPVLSVNRVPCSVFQDYIFFGVDSLTFFTVIRDITVKITVGFVVARLENHGAFWNY